MQQQEQMNNFEYGVVSSCSGSSNEKNYVYETQHNLKKDGYITWSVPTNVEENDIFIFYNNNENIRYFKSKMRLFRVTEIVTENNPEYLKIKNKKKWTTEELENTNICKMVPFFRNENRNLISEIEYDRYIKNCEWNICKQTTRKYTNIQKINSLKNALNHIINDKLNRERERIEREDREYFEHEEQKRRKKQHYRIVIKDNKRLQQQLYSLRQELMNKNLQIQRMNSRGLNRQPNYQYNPNYQFN
jgi:exonuclease VII large subunit